MPRSAPRLEVHAARIAGARWSIEIGGRLAPGWAGNLAAGLASRGVNIERGHAIGADTGVWSARFEIEGPAGFDASALDVGALAAREANADGAPQLVLERFALAPVREHDGSLHLAIEASDRVGFLASVLRRLAYFALFPIELRLDTQDGRIADELWLRGAAHRAPSAAIEEALRRALQAAVAPDA